MSNLLVIFSILLSTFGVKYAATNLDHEIVVSEAGSSNFAVEASAANIALPALLPRPRVTFGVAEPQIYAKRYSLYDLTTGTLLSSQNVTEKAPVASTTKIMTAILVLENYKFDDVVTISENAANQIDAGGFYVGEKLTVLNLLKATLIKSANGAAVALAEHMNQPGETGVDRFVNKMNGRARSLGATDTEYHDPAGLDVTGWSTARDLFLVTKYAMKSQTFMDIVGTKTETVADVTGRISHDLNNSNRLVNEWDYPGAIGIKTGYMVESGHCLVGAAERDGRTLVSIVLYTNADTVTASADESRKLLDWGFANVKWLN